MSATAPLRLERVHAIMLGVTDLPRSTAFYEDTLGLTRQMVEPGLALFNAGGLTIGLSPGFAQVRTPVAGAVDIAFAVADVRAAYDVLRQRGVEFLREPRQVTPTEWAANFKDPDGHILSVFGPAGS